jgi:molecular chaperone DnaK (HSP70)
MKLGIDFGTTRIVAAASDRGNFPVVTFESPEGEGCDWFPPLVGVQDGRWLFGWEAWGAQADPQATVVRSLKRYLPEAGPQTPVAVGDLTAPLAELMSGLAGALREALRHASNLQLAAGEPLEVMLGVPAGANSNQRYLTVEAFRQSGFHVLGLLNEPSAASIEYARTHTAKGNRKEAILIYDLGGGTFDASLVELGEHSHAVLASEGIATLGGDDFDALLAEAALEQAGLHAEALTQGEWFRLLEECRRKKEALHPNSRRITLDLDIEGDQLNTAVVPVADFYARCAALVEETFHAVDDLCARTDSLESVYVTGGGSELPLVGRMLREQYKSKYKRSPYTRAATAIGLAIQAAEAGEFLLRDQFTRYFGVWREAEGGRAMRFDPLFAKGTALPNAGEPPLEVTRDYPAVHNIGHFRYLECSHIDDAGQPAGDITVWDDVLFPFDPHLESVADLAPHRVERGWQSRPVRESYTCSTGGELQVRISNLEAGYARAYKLGRWGAQADALVPGKKKRTATKKKARGA